jgi:hypothetical protein
MPSTIYKKLSDDEIVNLKNELHRNSRWQPHSNNYIYKNKGALRDGETTWIVAKDDSLKTVFDCRENFPALFSIINKFANNNIGRVYYHKLESGQVIHKHNDANLSFIACLKNRYQIYFDIAEGVLINLDNGIIFDNHILSNSILDFDLKLNHYYINNSYNKLIFCVFDLLK